MLLVSLVFINGIQGHKGSNLQISKNNKTKTDKN